MCGWVIGDIPILVDTLYRFDFHLMVLFSMVEGLSPNVLLEIRFTQCNAIPWLIVFFSWKCDNGNLYSEKKLS